MQVIAARIDFQSWRDNASQEDRVNLLASLFWTAAWIVVDLELQA